MATKKKETVAVAVEESQVRDYELVFIVSPDVSDEALEAKIGSISQFVTSKGGTVSNIDQWGKRRLAYPLKRFLEGNYVLAQFNMSPVWSKDLEASLKISEEVLRHLLIKLED